MARPVSRQLSGVFYMLNYDLHKEVLQDFSSSHSRKVAGPAVTWREFPKGTLLERILEAPLYGRIVKDGTYIMRSLDDENGEFACSSSYVSPLSRKEMDLLQALSKRQERYEIYWYSKDLLRFAQTVQIGTQVFVKLKIQNTPEDVAGTVRYVGELPDQQGIQFGVELEECRGYGTTDGVFRHQRLFHCDQDCGVFVKMNRLKQRYNPPKPEKREAPSKHEEREAPPSPMGIYMGQRVSIFTEEQDQRQGEVIYYGKPKTANEEYVGIHLDSTCKVHERNNGVYKNKERLFTPRDVAHTILVPAFSVFPTGCLEDDHTVQGAELEDSFEDLSDYDIGDYVTIFTQEGEKEGVVLWKGVPMAGREPYVGIELSKQSKQCEQFSDGTFRGKRLFFPPNPERTILVPASSVVKTLTPDTVKDSLEPLPENLYKEGRVSEKPSAPRQIPRPPPDRVPFQTPHSLSRDHSDELKPGFVTPISEPKRPASGLPNTAAKKSGKKGKVSAMEPPFITKGSAHREDAGAPEEFLEVHRLKLQDKKLAAGKRAKSNPETSQSESWTMSKFFSLDRSKGKKTAEDPLLRREVDRDDKKHGSKRHPLRRADASASDDYTVDDDVLRAVAAHVAPFWKKFAKELKLIDSEVKSISLLHVSDRDCTMDMLRRWREQMACSRDKLRPLILACRKAELDGLANEIEQGLDDEDMLPYIARQVGADVWKLLGHCLGLAPEYLSQLELEEHDLTQRVYHMLLDWRVIQPFEADKQLVLAEALRSFGLNDLGLEVCRGLSLRILDHVSKSIGKSWKLFGQKLGLSDEDIGRVTDRGNDTNTARGILDKWKRRQDRNVDLLGVLSGALSACKKPKLAQMVIKGMDDDVLEIIANMMEHKLDDILMALRVPERVRFGTKDRGPPTTVELLKWWRACRLDGASNGRELLHSVLQRYGCHDAATLLWPCSTPTSEAAAAGEAEDLWPLKWPPAPAPATAPPQLIPQDVTTAVVLAEIGKVPCQPINLAAILNVPKTKRDRIFKGWSEMSKRNIFLLRDWVDRHEGVYPGHNLGMQLCKTLLEAGLVEHAELIVQGASANKEFFEQTDFQSTAPGEDEDVYYQAQTDVHRSPMGYDKDLIVADPTAEDGGLLLDVDSVVEVRLRGNSYSGLIRSIEKVPEWPDGEIAGIELEDPISGGTDGSFEGKQYFNCRRGRAVFLYLSQCRPDSRFPTGEDTYRYYRRETSQDFGGVDSPIEPDYISPQRFDRGSVGRNKGIQGDQNSCYLDVTLYSMFSFNETFDRMLLRDAEAADLPQFREIQKILKEAIVNPLRKHGFVRADRVRNLRLKLDELNLLPGLTNEEKDPEEFIHTLLKDVFKSQPLFKTRHGDTKEIDTHYLYQIFMDKNDSLDLPRVEQLLHQSFLDNELKFVEIPDCLIVQMPRFGKDYKMYQRILPSLTINITDLLENYQRQCTICGQLATLECRDCRPDVGISEEFIKSFCEACFNMTHIGSKPDHKKKALTVSEEIRLLSQELVSHEPLFQPQMMELFAVVCIQTSHYVAFVRAEPQSDQWVFFDSMADRDASHTPGFNIPIITHLPGFEKQVQDEARIKGTPDDKKLPEHLRRLLADSYICFYRRIGSKPRDPPKEWASGATNY